MKEKKKQKNCLIKKTITALIAIILFLTILIITLITVFHSVQASNLAFGRYRFYIMESASQPEIALRGDLVIAKKLKLGEVKPQDKIVYDGGRFLYCDNVVQTKKLNTVTKMVIIENNGLKYYFTDDEIEGKVVFNIHELGYIISFFRTSIGFIFFIIIVVVLFLLLKEILLRKKQKNISNKEKENNDVNIQDNIYEEKDIKTTNIQYEEQIDCNNKQKNEKMLK